MSDVHSWSTTAANNNSASPNGFPEAMAASGLNNSAREVMAAIAKWRSDNNGSLVSGGSADAYTLTPNATWAAYAAGMTFTFEANHTSTTTTPTLNVSGLGAKTITNQEGTALTIGDIVSGGIYTVTYDSGEGKFKLISAFVTGSGLTPHAYGRVASGGTLQTGSFGVSSNAYQSTGVNYVTLSTGVTDAAKAMVLATPAGTTGGDYTIQVRLASSTQLRVYTAIASTGAAVNLDFSFLVYDTN